MESATRGVVTAGDLPQGNRIRARGQPPAGDCSVNAVTIFMG